MKKRITFVAIQCLVFLALYFSTAYIAQARDITTPWLETRFDRAIPFIPAWVWIYMTAYFLDSAGICLATWKLDETGFRKILIACYINLFLFSGIHLLFPREAIKPAISLDSASGLAMTVIQWLTTKYNTFPSGHVSYSLITGWAAFKSYPRNRLLSAVIILDAVLVIASTLFIKEHVLVDVFGGIIVGVVSLIIAAKIVHPTAARIS